MTAVSLIPYIEAAAAGNDEKPRETMSLLLSQAEVELRRPLSLIQGYIEALKSGAIRKGELLGHCLDVMDRHSRQLMHVIDDLNAAAGLDDDPAPWCCDEISLRRRVEVALEHVMPLVDVTGVGIDIQIAPGGGEMHSARTIWHLIVSKLIEESLKHVHEGDRVLISAGWSADACVLTIETKAALSVQSMDEALTSPIKWAEAPLGVLVVRRAVELNHGTIEWQQCHGQPPRFEVRMPCGDASSCTVPGCHRPAATAQHRRSPRA